MTIATAPWNERISRKTGMTPRALLTLFVPLALIFAGISLFAYDLKHARTDTFSCRVLAVGRAAAPFRTSGNTLYTASGNPLHDIGLSCAQLGVVVVNEYDVFLAPVLQGAPVRLQHKTYRWLPQRWQLAVSTPGL